MKNVIISSTNPSKDKFVRNDRVLISFWDIDGTKAVNREGIILNRQMNDNFWPGHRYNILTNRNDGSRHIVLVFEGNILTDTSFYTSLKRDESLNRLGI